MILLEIGKMTKRLNASISLSNENHFSSGIEGWGARSRSADADQGRSTSPVRKD